jgi:hypothetical protein
MTGMGDSSYMDPAASTDSYYGANSNYNSHNNFPSRGFGGGPRGGFRGGRGRHAFAQDRIINANGPAPAWGPGGEFIGSNVSKNHGNAGHSAATAPKPAEPPLNAPSGPKAMREGQPNTGFRGRGGFPSNSTRVKEPAVAEAHDRRR